MLIYYFFVNLENRVKNKRNISLYLIASFRNDTSKYENKKITYYICQCFHQQN